MSDSDSERRGRDQFLSGPLPDTQSGNGLRLRGKSEGRRLRTIRRFSNTPIPSDRLQPADVMCERNAHLSQRSGGTCVRRIGGKNINFRWHRRKGDFFVFRLENRIEKRSTNNALESKTYAWNGFARWDAMKRIYLFLHKRQQDFRAVQIITGTTSQTYSGFRSVNSSPSVYKH